MRKVGFITLTVAFLLFLSVIPVSGTSWETPINITNDTTPQQYSVSLTVDSDGIVHIAWSTASSIGFPQFGKIYYTNNSGGSFNTPVLIPSPVNQSVAPSLAVDSSGNAHIAFFGGNRSVGSSSTPKTDIYYSTNKGPSGNFQTINLTDYNTGSIRPPDLALDSNGYAHIVWRDEVGDIRYGNNTGGAFGNEKATNENGSPIFFNPSLALDNSDKPHVVCWATDLNDFELFYTTKGAVGAAWLSLIAVTNDPISETDRIDDQFPDISVDNGLVHIAWKRSFWQSAVSRMLLTPRNTFTANSTHIFYTNGSINGFPTLVQVSSVGNWHTAPSLALDSADNAHIAWKNSTSYPYPFLYSNNTSGNFGSPETLPVSSDPNGNPSIFVDSDNYIHIAFSGFITGTYLDVIYLKSGDASVPVSEFIGQLLPLVILVWFATLVIGIRIAKKKRIS